MGSKVYILNVVIFWMEKVMIEVGEDTLERLKMLGNGGGESYDELLNVIIDVYEEEELNADEVVEVEEALESVKEEKFKSIGQVAMELGVELE